MPALPFVLPELGDECVDRTKLLLVSHPFDKGDPYPAAVDISAEIEEMCFEMEPPTPVEGRPIPDVHHAPVRTFVFR
jgi:hypothetical protein